MIFCPPPAGPAALVELPLPGSSLAASLAPPFPLSPWDLATVSGVAASRQGQVTPAALAQLKQRGLADHDAKVGRAFVPECCLARQL
jgi:hypothetical protein